MRRFVQRFVDLPIQRKISLAILGTCGTSLIVAAVAVFVAQVTTFRREFNRDLEAIGELVGYQASAAVTFNDQQTASNVLSFLKAKPYILRADIELPDATEFAHYESPAAAGRDLSHDGAERGIYMHRQPILLGGERVATLHLTCDYHAVFRESFTAYTAILVFVMGLAVSLALLLSHRLKRIITKPILHLAATANQVAEHKDYSLRARRISADEVGQLVQAFNSMLSRIQAQDHALTVSQEKLGTLINSIDGIVWECTPSFHYTFVSCQSERILGFAPEQWILNPDFRVERIHPEDLDQVRQACRQALEKRQPYNHEFRMLNAAGSIVWLRECGTVLVEEDRPAAIRGILLDITEQKASEQREQMNRTLIHTSRQAGMAEVATAVLHNVGNVLNSVNVSANVINERLRRSSCGQLRRLSALVNSHQSDLGVFLTQDARGKRVPEFMNQLASALEEEHQHITEETQSLTQSLEHIKEIVAMQQSYAKVAGVIEDVPPATLLEDALRMNTGGLARHGVEVRREFQEVPLVRVDRHKVLQILVNLLRNARQAMDAAETSCKVLTLALSRDETHVRVSVQDNGVGIAAENFTRIFRHGFTTKPDGHGFGLHSGALAAKEMGGSLQVASAGPGLGATFILTLPIANAR